MYRARLALIIQWVKEIKHYCGDVPKILVGLKSDLRMSMDDKCVSHAAVSYALFRLKS